MGAAKRGDAVTLASLDRRVTALEKRVAWRWLSVAATAKLLNVSINVVYAEIKDAVEAGRDRIFTRNGGGIRIRQVGRGTERPRYRASERDIVGASA